MTRLLSFLFGLILVASSSACQSGKPTISGAITGAAQQTLYLDRINPDGTNQAVDNAVLGEDGSFSFTSETPFPTGIYRLRVESDALFFALSGKEHKLTFNGPLSGLKTFQMDVSGSPQAEEYVTTIRDLMASGGSAEQTIAAVKAVKDPLVAMHMAQMIFRNDPTFLDIHQDIFKRLKAEYPGSEYTDYYATYVTKVENTYAKQQSLEKIKVGQEAPDIELPDPKGQVRRLSDLKGKVVLLDFWASWCGPCRKENPNVVEVYNKYKAKGFTVFSVSLDGLDERTKARFNGDEAQITERIQMSRDKWVEAIQADGLSWENHVSDLLKWDSGPASLYGVTSIPKTFLIDREGKIAKIDTRGVLEEEVLKIL